MELKVCENMINTNLLSHIAATKASLPGMKARKSGEIINVISGQGIIGLPMRTLYAASKFGLSGFGKALRSECMGDGIHVLQVYPGYVQTSISENAVTGSGKKFGKTDINTKNGMKVEDCCEEILKALNLKRTEVMIGNLSVHLIPLVAQFEFLTSMIGDWQYKKHLKQADKKD